MAAEKKSRGSASRIDPWMIGGVAWYLLVIAAGVVILLQAPAEKQVSLMLLDAILAIAPLGVLVAMRTGAGSTGVERELVTLTKAVNNMSQEQGLSEAAKRVLHRRQERELLRRAIEQDIADEDWDAAMVLVKELAERFGYRADAEEFRTRIERARMQTMDRRVVDALAELDEFIRSARWPEAYAEAARIQRLYPESHRVHGLRERVDDARVRFRKDLERKFLLAAERDEVEKAMECLRELDHYLTPTEAEPLQEVARGVIGKARDNLGVQFKLKMQDHQWNDAIDVGEQIMRQFPNTRMAAEVREVLPTLQERASKLATS